jgi:hypothetical protein
MTIEEHIKQAMVNYPLTKQQEDKLLLGLENYLNEIVEEKNGDIPLVNNSLDSHKLEQQKFIVKEELRIRILRVINGFKSKEEPHIMLSNDDIVNVLSSMIVRRT